jgi:hypothetical protein
MDRWLLAVCQPGSAWFYRSVLALPFLLPLAWREGRGTGRLGCRELLAAVVGGLTVLFAWLIFAGLLAILACLLLRHEQDPLQDLDRPCQGDQDQAGS